MFESRMNGNKWKTELIVLNRLAALSLHGKWKNYYEDSTITNIDWDNLICILLILKYNFYLIS